MRCFLLLFSFLLAIVGANAQPIHVPNHAPAYPLLERLSVTQGFYGPLHSEIREYARIDVVDFALHLDSASTRLSAKDKADIQYLFTDNPEYLPDSLNRQRGIFNTFYQHPAAFFAVRTPSFRLVANPMFNFHAGQTENDEPIFANQRGLELRGDVDGKVYYYTNFLESQARFPDYVAERVTKFRSIPGYNFYKGYESSIFGVSDAYDFNVANAYIGFNATQHIGIQLGHGKQFIGDGYRSVLLSDFGAYTFFLKINTRVWKFQLQNLFMELTTGSSRDTPGDNLNPKKFTALHYLSYNIRPNLSVGIFEATVFNRSRDFEFQYLNPVIFYRTVEGFIGSPDNVLLGINARWDVLRRVRIYGQFLLDEFNSEYIFGAEQPGWWGNKFAAQAGVKYFNAFGVDHLDVQVEYNAARPYTYAHRDSFNAYTHYNQPLAHPLLANFEETVVLARYQPFRRLLLEARWIHARTGDDRAGENWGTNILLSYQSREQEFFNTIGQGVRATTDILGLNASLQLYHNLFFDFRAFYRRKNSDDERLSRTTRYFSAGFRMNLWTQNLDF